MNTNDVLTKLIAEIERLKNQNERRLDNIVPIRRKDTMDEEQLAKIELRDKIDKAYLNGVLITLSDILSFITSLQQEQPEELEKKIDDWYNTMGIPVTTDALKETARHFYELGASVMRERITNPEYNQKIIEKMKSEYPADELNARKV